MLVHVFGLAMQNAAFCSTTHDLMITVKRFSSEVEQTYTIKTYDPHGRANNRSRDDSIQPKNVEPQVINSERGQIRFHHFNDL